MPSVSVPLYKHKGWDILMKQRREFWSTGNHNQLTAHFRGTEFFCHDGSAAPILAREGMVELCLIYLEPMRTKFGTCLILSGYRHTLYNAQIGGVPNSQHIYEHSFESVAADVRFEKGSPKEWQAEAKRLRAAKNEGDGGIGRYDRANFVHLDNRAYTADWSK